MAVKTLPPPDFKAENLQVFYNLTQPVGPGSQPNRPDDVMLVQLCLRKIFSNPALGFPPPDRGNALVADGNFGPITQAAIRHFQNELKHKEANVLPDGIVSVAYSAHGRIGHHVLTVCFLNLGLKKTIGEKRFHHLEDDFETPFGLKVALFASDIS